MLLLVAASLSARSHNEGVCSVSSSLDHLKVTRVICFVCTSQASAGVLNCVQRLSGKHGRSSKLKVLCVV